jgi:hypothetical protein
MWNGTNYVVTRHVASWQLCFECSCGLVLYTSSIITSLSVSERMTAVTLQGAVFLYLYLVHCIPEG